MEPRHRSRRAIDVSPQPRRRAERPTGTSTRGARHRSRIKEDAGLLALRSLQTQQIEDPFRDHLGAIREAAGLEVIEPPFNLSSLLRIPRENNMLRQCIDAMVTNVEGHGWRLEYVGEEDGEETAESLAEKETLTNLLKFPNPDQSFQEMRERVRRDLEYTGNAYLEIGRDREGRVVMVSHAPSHLMRLTVKEPNPVEVVATLPREGEGREQRVRRRFRRFVQAVGAKRVFFKEYGDPRPINPGTGRVDEGLGLEQQATEVLHIVQYAPGSAYGVPRWINQLPAILGSRQAELTNLDFFKDNAVPAMALLVSGGQVTQTVIDEVEDHFRAIRGRDSFNRIMIIEAHGDEDAASQDGTIPTPRMDMKPLQNERQRDALFQTYDQNNMSKVRSSFRMPPIFVGLAQDYTHATAKTSFEVAESQVFGPERARMDEMWNSRILSTYEPRFWALRSLPPRISDPSDIVDAIRAFDEAGAMTPNVAIGLANDFFDLEIPNIEAEWGDFPFSTVEQIVSQGFVPAGFEPLLGAAQLDTDEDDEEGEGEVPDELQDEGEQRIAILHNQTLGRLVTLRRAMTKANEARQQVPRVRHRSRPRAAA